MNLDKINVRKEDDEGRTSGAWCVWVPIPPEVEALGVPAPYGDTFWPSFEEAWAFVDRVLGSIVWGLI